MLGIERKVSWLKLKAQQPFVRSSFERKALAVASASFSVTIGTSPRPRSLAALSPHGWCCASAHCIEASLGLAHPSSPPCRVSRTTLPQSPWTLHIPATLTVSRGPRRPARPERVVRVPAIIHIHIFHPKTPMGSFISKATATDAQRIQRARTALATALVAVEHVGWTLPLLGAAAIVAIASSGIAKKGYANNIDENAMLPGQASVYFAPSDVENHVPALASLSRKDRSAYIAKSLQKAGLDVGTQSVWEFWNVYAVMRAPRASGTESVLLSAPWLCMDGEYNINGFNYLLSLAAYLPKFSHWSKDTIFLFSDGGLVGSRAWLDAYHGFEDFHPNVKVSPIMHHGGVIEEAMNLEFSGTQSSYESLGIYVQGLNGQQPNADIPMTVAAAANTYTIPIRLHKTRSEAGTQLVNWVWKTFKPNQAVMGHLEGVVGLAEFMAIQALGVPMSHHALFPKYKIEGVTIVGVNGPQRSGPVDAQRVCLTVESTLRSFNSLLERLHHAFWFYMMFSIYDYLPIAFYIAPIILLSVGLFFEAFLLFTEGEFVKDRNQLTPSVDEKLKLLVRPAGVSSFLVNPRPMQLPLAVLSACFGLMWTGYWAATRTPGVFDQPLSTLIICGAVLQLTFAVAIMPILKLLIQPPQNETVSQWKLLKSLTYSALAAVLLTISTLNPSFSAFLALPVVPLVRVTALPSKNLPIKMMRLILLQLASPVGILTLLVAGLGERAARTLLEQVWDAGFWLEGWQYDAVVFFYWPLCLALQVVVGGF
ncbi:Gaa1-like protein [Chytriomyces sp. MP71]|nr:Gaa1-like protein [Chytriomyces sp. MP71]